MPALTNQYRQQAAANNQAEAVPAISGQVSIGIIELRKTTEVLHERLANLEVRLAPLRMPSPVDPKATVGAPRTVVAPLAEDLRQIEDRIYDAIKVAEDLLTTIQL